MCKVIHIFLIIGTLLGKQNSIYFFEFKKIGTTNIRTIEAIQNTIKKSILSSNKFELREEIEMSNFLKQNRMDLIDCDNVCYKNLGLQNNLNYLVKGDIFKKGQSWHVDIMIIDVFSNDEPDVLSLKSKRGTIKLLPKIKKKLNDYIFQNVEQSLIPKENSKNLVFGLQNSELLNDCTDGEIEIWGKCYSVSETDSLILNNKPYFENGVMLKKHANLEGEISDNISALINLKYLDLSYNNLEGDIPASFNNITNLEHVDLSNNNLSGDFDSLVEFFSSIKFVNLSGNAWYDYRPIWADTWCGFNVKVEDKLSHNTWEGVNDYFGLTHGTFKEWYDEDLLKTEVTYFYGSLKTFNHWDINGNKLITNGNGVYKDFWRENVILMEGKVIGGLMEEEWRFYYGEDETWGDPQGNSFKQEKKGENPLVASIFYKNGKGFRDIPYHETWGDSNPSHGIINYKYYFATGELYRERFVNGSFTLYDLGGNKVEEYIVDEFENKNIKYLKYDNGLVTGKYEKIWLDDNNFKEKCYENGIDCTSFSEGWAGRPYYGFQGCHCDE